MRIYILDIKETGLNSICVYGKREDGTNVYICIDNFPRFCYALDNSSFQSSVLDILRGEDRLDVMSEQFIEAVNTAVMPYYEVKGVVRHPVKVAFDRENVMGLDDDDIAKRGLLITYLKTDDHNHTQDYSFPSIYSQSALSVSYGLSSIFGNVDQLKQAFMLAIGFTGPGWYNVDHGQLRDKSTIKIFDHRIRGECFRINHPRDFQQWKERITPIPVERADFSKHPPLDVAFCYMQSSRPKESNGKIVASLSVKFVAKVTDLTDLNNDANSLRHIIINGDLLSEKQKENHIRRTMCSFVYSSTDNFASDVSKLFARINPDVIVCHGSFFETGECEASWFDVFQNCQSPELLASLNKGAFKDESMYSGFMNSCRRYAKRMPIAHSTDSDVRNLFSGVICCDTATSCKVNVSYRSYYLDAILRDRSQQEIVSSLSRRYSKAASLTKALRSFHRFSFSESHINAIIDHIVVALDAIGYVEQITNALYLALNNSSMTKSTWNEALTFTTRTLSHRLYSYEFHQRGYALPLRKQFNHSKYKGGKVISPPKGLIKTKTVWYDFASHYPSIILEFNICHTTTLKGGKRRTDLKKSIRVLMNEMRRIDASEGGRTQLGVIPELIQKLISLKSHVKSLLQSCTDEKEKKKLAILYFSCKVIINSLYGAFGDEYNMYYDHSLASLITRLGREALDITIDTFNEHASQNDDRGKVIYADTDSTGLDTKSRGDPKQLLEEFDVVKDKINSNFRHMKLEADGVFSRMLFTNKKRYIGYKWDPKHNLYKLEVKGLEMIKRDWPGFLSKCLEEFAPILLTDADGYINFEEIGAVIDKWIKGLTTDPASLGLDIGDFIITNRIDKKNKQKLGGGGGDDCEDETAREEKKTNNTQPPHVILANRARKTHDVRYKNDTVVSYIYAANTPFVRKLFENVELSEKYDSLPLDVNEIYYHSQEAFKVPVGDLVDKALYVKKFFLRPIASMFKSWEIGCEDPQMLANLVQILEGDAAPAARSVPIQGLTRLEDASNGASSLFVDRLVSSYGDIYGKDDSLKRVAEAKRPILMCHHCRTLSPMQGIFKQGDAQFQVVDDLSCAFTCPKCTRDLDPKVVVGSMVPYISALSGLLRDCATQDKLASMVIKRTCAECTSDLNVALDYELYGKLKKKTGSVTVISCSDNIMKDKVYIFDQCRAQTVMFGMDNANNFINVMGSVLSNWNK